MSKQTDLINIPDAITVSGSNVDIGANSLSIGANNANSPQILFENSDGVTGDAALSTYDDASGTMLVMGSNFYINSSGSESRFNTSEESSAVMLNRNGDLNLLTGGTGATATTRLKIDASGAVTIPSQPMVFVTRTANQSVNTDSNNSTKLDFNNEIFDIGNDFNTSNDRFTAPTTGRYEISWSYATNNSSQSVYRTFIWKNGSKLTYTQLRNDSNGTTGYAFASRTAILPMNVNDYLELKASTDNGTDFYADNELRLCMTIRLIG